MTQKNYFRDLDEAGLAKAVDEERQQIAGNGKIASLGCGGWGVTERMRVNTGSKSIELITEYMQGTTGWVKTRAVAEHVNISNATADGALKRMTSNGKLLSKLDHDEFGRKVRFWQFVEAGK